MSAVAGNVDHAPRGRERDLHEQRGRVVDGDADGRSADLPGALGAGDLGRDSFEVPAAFQNAPGHRDALRIGAGPQHQGQRDAALPSGMDRAIERRVAERPGDAIHLNPEFRRDDAAGAVDRQHQGKIYGITRRGHGRS